MKDDADRLTVLLDCPRIDAGTACEIEYFYAGRRMEQKIIRIGTEARRAGKSESGIVNARLKWCVL